MTDILFIASDYKPRPGGIAAYVDTLARGLRTLGHNAEVLAIVPADEKERLSFLQSYEPWVFPFAVVHDERPANWFSAKLVSLLEIARCLSPRARRVVEKTSAFRNSCESIARLEEILSRENPRVVVFGHLDQKLYSFALCLRERKIPYGIIAHDVEVCRSPYKINDHVRKGGMLKRAAWLAANSRHTKSLLQMWGIAEEKIAIVHPPVSDGLLQAAVGVTPGTTRQTFNLLTICRVVQAKGIDIVLRALKHLSDRGISFRYVVAGQGPERNNLEALAEDLGLSGKVQFAGSVTEEQKCSLLQSADVFVMPSRVNPREQHEGFGLAFIEAAAFGVPSVGSRAGGIPEAILDGKTGILVDPESPEKLADALMFLYQHPEKRKDMGHIGRQRATELFSPGFIAAQFLEEMHRRLSPGIARPTMECAWDIWRNGASGGVARTTRDSVLTGDKYE